MPLTFVTVNPIKRHTASFIFLHGLGDSGEGWAPVFRFLAPLHPHVKFILPNAPSMPVTLNFGGRMPSWFDLKSLDEESLMAEGGEDESGMLESRSGINDLIAKEVDAGIEGNRIVVGGFSQGGAIGLLTGLTSERKLGGIISLSSWLPMNKKMGSMMSDSARNIPIFFGHGKDDTVVQYKFGRNSYEILKTRPFGFTDATEDSVKGLTWKEYPGMAHSSDPREIGDFSEWMGKVLPSTEE